MIKRIEMTTATKLGLAKYCNSKAINMEAVLNRRKPSIVNLSKYLESSSSKKY